MWEEKFVKSTFSQNSLTYRLRWFTLYSGVCDLQYLVHVVYSIQWCLWFTVYSGVCGLQYTVLYVVYSIQWWLWFTVYSGVCCDLPQPRPPRPRSAPRVAVNGPVSCTPADCTAVDSCSSQDPYSSASSRTTLH